MPTGLLIGGATLGGAALSASAAKKAANVQSAAANRGMDIQERMFEQTQGYLAPYRQIGEGAVASLAQLYGLPTPGQPDGGQPFGPNALEAFRAYPGYQFARDEGLKAIEYSRAAGNMLQNPGTLAEMQRFGTGLADQTFGRYVGQLNQLAGFGLNAAAGTGTAATNTGNALAQLALGQGEAQASGIVGSANAINAGIGSGVNNYLMLQALNRGSSYGAPMGSTVPSVGYLPAYQPTSFPGVGAYPY